VPKTEDQMAEDGDPTKTQPVKDPPAVLAKALQLIESPDENWYESSSYLSSVTLWCCAEYEILSFLFHRLM